MRLPIVILFVLLTFTLWRPFTIHKVVYGVNESVLHPAGEIIPSFDLSQHVVPPTKVGAIANGLPTCVSIRFATYMRRNRGNFLVTWRQGDATQTWRIEQSDIEDNVFREFCPDTAFSLTKPFDIRVHGSNGERGHAATVWLSSSKQFGIARGAHGESLGSTIAIRVGFRRHVSIGTIATTAHGAFFIGWFATLIIGVAALLAGLHVKRPR